MTLDPVLVSLIARSGETAMKQALRYDPGTRAALEDLSGRLIAFEFTEPRFKLYLSVIDAEPRLLSYSEQIPDCLLRGSAPAIAALALQERTTLAGSGVELSGNPQLLAELKRLLAGVEIDWEEPLTDLLGNVPGHTLAQTLRQFAGRTWQSSSKLPNYLAEYLTEELRTVVGEHELQDFHQGVDELRADADRLEARLAELDRLLQKQA